MSLFNTNKTRISYISTETGEKVYPVLVDVKKGVQGGESIQFVSSDINTGMLSVAFMLDNADYNVSGTEVICTIQRPDATILEIPCKHISNNVVEVYLGVNGTSQGGTYTFDFKVYKGGDKVVGTPILNYTVSQSISSDNSIEEDDRLPVLNQLIIQVNNAIESIPSTEEFEERFSSIEEEISSIKENGSGGVSNTILAKYIHVGNQEIYLTDFDISTGVFTCNAPHNLTKNTLVMPRLKANGKFYNIPKECLLSGGELTLVPQTSTTFTLNGITFNETNNTNVDVSKFYFECFKKQRLILDFKEEVKSINVRIYGTTGGGDLYTCAYYDGFFDNSISSTSGGSTCYNGATAMSSNATHFNPRYFNMFFNMSIVDNLIATNGNTTQIGFNTNRAITSKSIAQVASVVEFFRNSFTGLCIGSRVHDWCLTNGLTIIIEKCGE